MKTTDNQKELFIVVDKDDNILGYKTRQECHSDKSIIHRAIGVIITNDRNEILLQKRSLTKDIDPGLWTLSCSGHVDKGETNEESARRELREELGIEVPIVFKYKFVRVYSQETEMEAIFEAKSNGPFKPNPNEVDEVRFFVKNELQEKVKSKEIIMTDYAHHILIKEGILK